MQFYIHQLSWRGRYTLGALPVVCVLVVVYLGGGWWGDIYGKTNQTRL